MVRGLMFTVASRASIFVRRNGRLSVLLISGSTRKRRVKRISLALWTRTPFIRLFSSLGVGRVVGRAWYIVRL